MTLAIDLLKQAAEQFLIRLLPEDRGRVGAFNDKIEFHPKDDFTNDRDVLIRSLKELDFGYPTRLHDAIDESLTELSAVKGRKVVLVFTDGDDTSSKVTYDQALTAVIKSGAMVYVISKARFFINQVKATYGGKVGKVFGTGGAADQISARLERGEQLMTNLAARTGGRVYLSDEGGPDWTYGFTGDTGVTRRT